MKNTTPCEEREKHYVEHHLDFLGEEMNKLKGRSGHMDIENVRALSEAMKNQMKESEEREGALREKVMHLERMKAKSEEKLMEFAQMKDRERAEEEKRRESQRRQHEEKIGELESKLCECQASLMSTIKDHDRLLEKYNKLNNDHAIEFNDAKSRETNLKSEMEIIKKDRDSVKLEYGKVKEDLSRHSAVISSFKAAELGIRNEIATKNQEISRLQSNVSELETAKEKNLKELEDEKENYAECYSQLKHYQNNNHFLEKTVQELDANLSHQSREIAEERENNNSLLSEVKRLCNTKEEQTKTIADLNEKIKQLDDVIIKNGQQEHSLSLKFNSCIEQMETMENKLVESQNIFLCERQSKEQAEKLIIELRNEVSNLNKEREDQAQEMAADRSKFMKVDSKRKELAITLKCTNEQNAQRFADVESQLSEEKRRTKELVQENEQKGSLIRQLQEDINAHVKSVASVEKINEIFSVEVDKMVAKCQNMEQCQDENVALRSELLRRNDEMNSVIRKEQEESDILRKRVATLEETENNLTKENEKSRQMEVLHLDQIKNFEHEKMELTMLVNELAANKKRQEREKHEAECEIQKIRSINDEISGENKKMLETNTLLMKETAQYECALAQTKNDLLSSTKRVEVISLENDKMRRQLEEANKDALHRSKQQSLVETSAKSLQCQVVELKSENTLLANERDHLRDELRELRLTAEEQQTTLSEFCNREQESDRLKIHSLKELEKYELSVEALKKQLEEVTTKLSASHHQAIIDEENIRSLEKRISSEVEEHQLTKIEKERCTEALKSLTEEFKSYFQKFEESETNACSRLKQIEQLSQQLHKINHDVSIGKSLLAEKTSKVESLSEENNDLTTANRRLENELNRHTKTSDELKNNLDKALLQLATLKDQYEKHKRDGESASFTLREAHDKNIQYEVESNKLKVTVSALKEKLNDQQRVIDELDYKENMKLQHKENKEVEIRTLKTSNSDLQGQVHLLKEEVARQKVQTDKYKEESMSRKVEVDNLLQESERLKRISSNNHEPCKNKIVGLESKVEGLRDKELREKKR